MALLSVAGSLLVIFGVAADECHSWSRRDGLAHRHAGGVDERCVPGYQQCGFGGLFRRLPALKSAEGARRDDSAQRHTRAD
jgi:hypothetical protein